jgi:hypothetical protein
MIYGFKTNKCDGLYLRLHIKRLSESFDFLFCITFFALFFFVSQKMRSFASELKNKLQIMKKIIVAIVAALTFALPSSAQINWGLKAGMNVTNVSVSSETFSKNNRCGYFVGPQMDITIPLVGLGFDAALLYENKSISNGETDETLNYVDLPINVKYTIGFSSLASVYLATGPQFSWNLGDNTIFENSYSLKSSQFYWNVGAGVTVLSKIRVGYTYNIPCGDTAEASISNVNFKNRTHQFHLTYLF